MQNKLTDRTEWSQSARLSKHHQATCTDTTKCVNCKESQLIHMYHKTTASTFTAASEPSALKSSYFITSAMMKPFSKSVWILPAACGAFVPRCIGNNNIRNIKTNCHSSHQSTTPSLYLQVERELVYFLDLEPGIFFEGFNIARWGSFPQFGSYLWKNWLDLYENFTRNVSMDKEVHITFWKSSGSGLRIQTGCALVEVCTLQVLTYSHTW